MAQSFVWGANGQQMTPEQVEQLRVVSALAARNGASAAPVAHWSQGLARLADAWGGYRGNLRADAQEAAGMASADAALRSNPILSSTLGADQPLTTEAPSVVSALSGGFPASLIETESGGNWKALNSEGYGGRLQFGASRLADAARAGIIPAGMTGADFSKLPPEQQQAVERWHFADIDQQAAKRGLNQFVGKEVGGVPITQDGIRAMAHLGGIGGAARFLESGGQINPSDSNGTSLRDYAARHGGGSLGGTISGAQQPTSAPNSVVAALAQAQANPWVAKKYGGVIDALMGQQMQRDDQTFAAQMRMSDPLYQAQLAQANMQMEQMRNPAVQPIEINGQLVNPATGEVIGDYRTQDGGIGALPAEVQALAWRAEQAGLIPGTPEYQDFVRNSGRNAPGVPAGFAALDAQAKAAGLIEGSPEYQEFMLGAGAGQRAQATAVGKAAGEAQINLPSTVEQAERAIRNLEAIRGDPALPGITGMIQGRVAPLTQAGTDLNTRIDQAKGQTFLEAFESLKGGGQITEIEGQKAEQAIARLNRAQSTEAYQQALNDLIGVLNVGIQRAHKRAGVEFQPDAAAPSTGQPVRRRYNPQTGGFE